jgi:hypothetical protein
MLPAYWSEFLSLVADLRPRTVEIWTVGGWFETKSTGTAYASFLKNRPPYGSICLDSPYLFDSVFSQSWTLYASLGGQFMRLLSLDAGEGDAVEAEPAVPLTDFKTNIKPPVTELPVLKRLGQLTFLSDDLLAVLGPVCRQISEQAIAAAFTETTATSNDPPDTDE